MLYCMCLFFLLDVGKFKNKKSVRPFCPLDPHVDLGSWQHRRCLLNISQIKYIYICFIVCVCICTHVHTHTQSRIDWLSNIEIFSHVNLLLLQTLLAL